METLESMNSEIKKFNDEIPKVKKKSTINKIFSTVQDTLKDKRKQDD